MSDRTCSVGDCDGLTGVPGTARGWCSAHYQRWQRHGDPLGRPEYRNKGKPCSVEGCEKPAKQNARCSMHDTRVQRYGSTEHPEAWGRSPEGHKWCPRCQRYKRLEEFALNQHNRDGHQSECKVCGAQRANQWRVANPEKQAAQIANRDRDRGNEVARQSRRRRQAEGRIPTNDRRARIRGREREIFTRLEIAERDGWRCQICGTRIGRSYRWPHPRSLSIDHIVPIVVGGHHVRANVQATHLHCNLSKKARGTDQLRLLG